MPAGRPTKYRPEMCESIITSMSQGLSKEAAAYEIGVSKQRLYDWAEKYPEFRDAIKEGEQASLKFWEYVGIRGVCGSIDGFNATAWIFNMKNRAGWRDKMEHTGEDGGPIKTETKLLNVVGVKADETK